MNLKLPFSKQNLAYLGIAGSVLGALFAICLTVSHFHLDSVVKSYRLSTLRSFEQYKMVLENARWPAQRADRLSLNHHQLTAEEMTSVESQLLQVSFGIDYDYFLLRASGQTRVEIRKGALHNDKSPISILSEERFEKNASDLLLRPCTISGKQFACLLAFPLEGEVISTRTGSYLVVGISPEDLISKAKYAQVENSIWMPTPLVSFRIGDNTYAFNRVANENGLLSANSPLDEGVEIVGVITLPAILFCCLVWLLTLLFTVLPIAWVVQARVRRRIRAKMELELLNSRVLHADKINRLVKGVIHDIKSPLSALTLISQSSTNAGTDCLTEHVIKRMRMIIRDLEAKVNNGGDETEFAALPLHSILRLIVSEKDKELCRAQCLQLSLPDRPVWVSGHFSELMRVFSNLINNAAEASEPHSPIWVSLEQLQDGSVKISIQDRGQGMSAQVLQRVREKGGSYGKKSGSGIGLQHARQTVERMSGKLSIESAAGVGTVVSILLPECEKPPWAIEKLDLRNFDELVLVDDESVTQSLVWRSKLQGTGVSLSVFKHPSEVPGSLLASPRHLFIVDNTFGLESGLGLKFIQQHFGANSILVTADWQASDIQKTIGILNVPLCGKEFIEHLEVLQ